MAPVLAIAGLVAGPSQPRRLDPGGEIFQPFVTGPNRIPFSMQESRDDGGEEVVAQPKREKRVDTATAIGGPGPDRFIMRAPSPRLRSGQALSPAFGERV